MKWIAIAITVSKKTILFPCGGLINRRMKMRVEQIEKLIIGDKYHLLRDKQKESYLLYQAKRLGLFIKNLTTKETEDE